MTTTVKDLVFKPEPSRKIGSIIEIDGLNATILEQSGNKAKVILLNDSFRIGNTVVCNNGIVQRVVNSQKSPKVVRI